MLFKKKKMKTINKKLVAALLCASGITIYAQNDFPFNEIESDNENGSFNTTINVNGDPSEFNNLLLGSNVDVNTTRLRGLNNAPLLGPNREVVNQNRGFQGFNSQIAQDFISDRDPVVLRFPQGVFANSYNWEQVRDQNGNVIAEADSRHILDPLVDGDRVISRHDSPVDVRIGYPALRGIFDRASQDGKPLDLLTVLNVVGNDGVSNGRRWQSMIDDGFDVRDMELGNEFFFRSQRTGTISNESQWVNRARRIVTNIRGRAARLGREVRFALPITYRASDTIEPQRRRDSDQAFNDAITQDESIFDALVVHRYVREQRTNGILPSQLTSTNLRRLLLASRIMDTSLSYAKTQVSENKNSLWLTEWGVAGSEEEGVGAAFLGTADTYTHLIRNQRRLELERINWFSTFGSNAQYIFDEDENRITTGYGRIYELFRGLLRDSELYENTVITTDDLETPSRKISKAVNAVAVRVGDRRITYIVTNLANKSTQLSLRRNRERQTGFDVRLSGISMSNLRTTEPTLRNPVVRTNQNTISIPRYSVMRVEVIFDDPIAARTQGEAVLSVNNFNNNDADVKLYPNPSDGNFSIDLPKTDKAVKISINDINGKTIFETSTKESSINFDKQSELSSGIYFVKVEDSNSKVYTQKVIIN